MDRTCLLRRPRKRRRVRQPYRSINQAEVPDLARLDNSRERRRIRNRRSRGGNPGHRGSAAPGFQHIDLIRRELDDEVEFVTIMWFDGLDSIKAFIGDNHTISHVPPAAQAVLARLDRHAAHYTVIDRRTQPPATV